MGLCTLGELEEMEPSHGRPSVDEIYERGVMMARVYYEDHHVYPHTSLGAFHYRSGEYKDAMRSWADAAAVISK